MIQKVEQKVIFNLTRAFAWIILIPACIGLVLYGMKVGDALMSGSSSPKVTYEEVKERMSPKEAVQGSPTSIKVNKPDASAPYDKKLRDIVAAFGPNMDQQKGVALFRSLVMKVAEKDRNAWLDGLLNVARSAPEAERFAAADLYISLWEEKSMKTAMDQAAKTQEQHQSLILFATSFAAVAVISLMLILLAVEKNTRRIDTTA